MVMVVSWYIKGSLLDTTNRSFVSTVTLFLFFFSTNIIFLPAQTPPHLPLPPKPPPPLFPVLLLPITMSNCTSY